MLGKPTSPLSTLPHLLSTSSPSAGPRWSPPFCGRLCSSPRALSRLSACSSCCPSFPPSVPLLPWHVARHCTRLFLLFAGWSSRLRPGHACCPAARGTPPWHPIPSCRLPTCRSPRLGLPQHSLVLDNHCAQVARHAALLLAPPPPLFSHPLSALCLPFVPSLFALPLTRTLHNNVRGTVFSPCPGPSYCCAHGAWQPSKLPGPSVGCLLASSVPLSRPLCSSPLLGSLCPFLSPRAPPYSDSLCSSTL